MKYSEATKLDKSIGERYKIYEYYTDPAYDIYSLAQTIQYIRRLSY